MSCPSTSSGLIATTAGVAVSDMPGKLRGVIAGADGTNAATVTVYDNPSAASGTILAKIVVDATLTHESFLPPGGIVVNRGLFVVVAGTGSEAIIYFDKG